MNIDTSAYRVRAGDKVHLRKWSTRTDPLYATKRDYEEKLEANRARLREDQSLLYAHNRYALLLIFQAMDGAGKDSAIKHVMSGINPQACQVHSFQAPSTEELEHDFLWRTTVRLPERGRIGVFNRSYYEEVLVARVRPDVLARQRLPDELASDPEIWEQRFESINDFERHLHRNGTRVVKFFLHLSKQEQARRFLSRIDDPRKNWKFDAADLSAREHWDQYQAAYEACLSATATKHAPWYVVPADDKKTARLIISQVIVETIDALDLHYPKLDATQREEMQTARRVLEQERG